MIRPDLSLPIPEHIERRALHRHRRLRHVGLARMFLERGIRVSGSDRADSQALRDLAARRRHACTSGTMPRTSATPTPSIHTGAHLAGEPRVRHWRRNAGCRSSTARRRSHWLIGGRRLVSVAGAHGKTTSTGMIVTALRALGEDPTFVNGGVIAQLGVVERDRVGRPVRRSRPTSPTARSCSTTRRSRSSRTSTPTTSTTTAPTTRSTTRSRRSRTGPARPSSSRPTTPGRARVAAAAHASARPHVRRVGCRRRARAPTSAPTDPCRSRSVIGGVAVDARLAVPGAHNAINAAGAVAVLLTLGYGLERRRPRGRGLRGHRAPLRAARRRARRQRLRRLRAPPDRGRGGPGGRAHGRRRRPDHRDPPAAHLLAHAADVPRVRRGARALRRPHRRARRLRRARGPGAGRHRRARLRARSRTRRTCTTSPTGRQAADYTATVARDGDYVITLGCGNVYQIIPQVLDALRSATAPARRTERRVAPHAPADAAAAAAAAASRGARGASAALGPVDAARGERRAGETAARSGRDADADPTSRRSSR